jgi:hypothetical protein
MSNGSPQLTPALDDTIWAIDRWGVQGITVSGVAGENASEANKATARLLAQFAVNRLAAADINGRATVMAPDRSPHASGNRSGVEFEVVKAPRRATVQP